jgi:hypothetical protein
MKTAWEDRLTSVVFPAQLAGFHMYTGLGELQPGTGLPDTDKSAEANEAALRKPMGLPRWQVYLGAKATQPTIRFLQLVHKVYNPAGSATLVYPTRLRNDQDRGVALIVPLGEGLDTPPHELTIARDLQDLVLLRPVKVIALGRFRAFTTKSPWTLSEHILMEVFSEAGDLIWTNPFIGMSLEEAIGKLRRKEPFQARATPPGATNGVAPGKRQEVEAEIRHLVGQGLSADEIQGHLARTRGLDLKVASRLYDGFLARNEPSPEVQAIVRHWAEQLEDYYAGEELFRAVAEDSGQSLDTVRKVLGGAPEEGRGPSRGGAH